MRVEINGLSKQFNNVMVLNDLDFSDDISTLAVIGSSGTGKSTLLRIIGGLLSPDKGTVTIDGMELPKEKAKCVEYRKHLGFVFQQDGLFKHWSAMDNIVIPLMKVHGVSKEEAQDKAEKLLSRFGLLSEAQKKPFALSGGEKQRIAIARAIAAKPKILLLDEPTSALDPEYKAEVLDMINELSQEGMHFIIVTHEMGFARHACEKIAFLHDGKILEYGDSNYLFKNPRSQELSKFLSKLLEWKI